MKEINLNIKLDSPVYKNKEQTPEEIKNKVPIEKVEIPAYEIAVRWIQQALETAINDIDPQTGRPRKAVKLEVHRRYNRVMNALEAHKEGIAQLEDDDYDFLNRKYHQAEMSVHREVSKVLDMISLAINQTNKVEE